MVAAVALDPPLAVDGGKPIRSSAWPSWPVFESDEVDAASAVLRSGKVNYWTGQQGRAFEAEFAEAIGASHAIACANGTVALELALFGLGVGTGDEVIVPPRTFVATASAVAMSGATPRFADICPDSGNLTAASIAAAITSRTRAVIVVHVGGWPADMPAIVELCRSRSIAVIEDCAQAHRARIDGASVGSFGDVSAFSFCQDKIMTTGGEGGMVVTSDEALWSAMWSRKDHGKSYAAVYEREHPPGFRWLHESWGTNGRLTEMQSAIGRAQLGKLDRWVDRRRALAHRLLSRLASLPGLRAPTPPPGTEHAHYRAYAYVQPKELAAGWDRDRIMNAIVAEGVPCRSGSCSEIYLEKAFDDGDRPAERLPVARRLGETSLCFTVHPTLADDDIDDVSAAVERVLVVATKP